MYQKVAQKLANSEMDCTQGDAVFVVIDKVDLVLIEPKNDARTVSCLALCCEARERVTGDLGAPFLPQYLPASAKLGQEH